MEEMEKKREERGENPDLAGFQPRIFHLLTCALTIRPAFCWDFLLLY